MTKSKKDPVLSSLETLEKSNIEANELPENEQKSDTPEKNDSIQAVKPKRERTPAQMAVFEKAQANRAANIIKKREESERIQAEEKKKKEEKLIKKAVAVRKKQLKREAVLDELSDDDSPVQRDKPITQKAVHQAPVPDKPAKPVFVFF